MAYHKWKDIKRSKGPEADERMRKRVQVTILEMNLAELRKELGITQVAVADAAGMLQAEVSKVERRDDHLLSTLRCYVGALGGELEVHAVVGDKRVKLVGV